MLLEAADDMKIELGESWCIGNSISDVEAGSRAGCKTVLIDTPSHQRETGSHMSSDGVSPDYRAVNIKEAVIKNNAKVIVADPRRIDLVRFSKMHVSQKPGTDVALLNAMMNVIIEEGLEDKKFIEDRTEDYQLLVEAVKDCTPEWAEPITTIPAADIRKFAKIFANAKAASIVVYRVTPCCRLSVLRALHRWSGTSTRGAAPWNR